MNHVQMLSWPFYLRRLCTSGYTITGYYMIIIASNVFRSSGLELVLAGFTVILCALLFLASYCATKEMLPNANASLAQMRNHQIPVLAEMRRHKAWVLGPVVLALFLATFVFLVFLTTRLGEYPALPRYLVLLIVIFLVVFTIAGVLSMYFTLYYLFRRDIKRNWQMSEAGGKSFVLYLRTFSSDFTSVNFPGWKWEIRMYPVERGMSKSATVMGLVGVAVGAPGEAMPPLGFERLYFSEAEWQSEVSSLIRRSTVIILNSSPTKWVEWELAEIRRHGAINKLILMTYAPTADKRVEHLSFALRVLGSTKELCRECSPYTIALSQLHKAEPDAIDAYATDPFSFSDATTIGIYTLIGSAKV